MDNDIAYATNVTAEIESYVNMKVKHLKAILASIENLELDGIKIDTDEMDVIIPVVDETDKDRIRGFRHVRTSGILANVYEPEVALCLSAPDDGMDMIRQLEYSEHSGTQCKKLLF